MASKEGQFHAGLGDPILLDKIDQLLSCNVGEHINLPQLVVVGDQSSGKSSVLEALTKLPFPRDSGLCTRFATQIIFRRSKSASGRRFTISIIPSPHADPVRIARLKAWKTTDVEKLDAGSFSKIMSEVHAVMGLSDQDSKGEDSRATFSKDVLRLEISGPDEDHLSVIDVPGIFKNTTPGITTKADIEMVKDMVVGYMQNPRSLMLAVVPANVDIATQEILEMAREFDPDGERTLGVLTKPDLVDKGAEKRIEDLVEGREPGMKLGWTLVRNPGQQQLLDQSMDRDSIEEVFFRDVQPWSKLDKSKVGIGSLKSRLQEVQSAHIRREFPKVRSEITKKLEANRKLLNALGTERETVDQQSIYLLKIVEKVSDITSSALTTSYGEYGLFDGDEDLRLATAVRNRNEKFADDLATWGQTYHFAPPLRFGQGEDDPYEKLPQREEVSEQESYQLFIRKYDKNLPDLEGILHEDEGLLMPEDTGILDWIESLYHTSRGFEIGTFSPALLSTIMKKQSAKWESLALGYISDIIALVHNFIVEVLKSVCREERLHLNLLSLLMDELIDKYKNAIEHVRFLLHVERVGTLMTFDPSLDRNIKANQFLRGNLSKGKNTPIAIFNHSKTDKSVNAIPNVYGHTVRNIHDILSAYYGIASKRFVDNVCMQASDYYLIAGPLTPLKLLTPSFVTRLTPEQLDDVAGEDTILRRKRAQLKREIADLEAGRKVL